LVPWLKSLAAEPFMASGVAVLYYLFFSVLLMIPQVFMEGSEGSAAQEYRRRKKLQSN
jgi:hypothetical protein